MTLVHRLFRCAIIEGTESDITEGRRRLISYYGDKNKGNAIADLLALLVQWDALIEEDKEAPEPLINSIWEANKKVGLLFFGEIKESDPLVARDILRTLPECFAKDDLLVYNNRRRKGCSSQELEDFVKRSSCLNQYGG